MDRREKMTPLERDAWRTTADALDKCRTGAKELDRIMAGATHAARSACSFMSRITASELAPD
jgi:hypothetical protein